MNSKSRSLKTPFVDYVPYFVIIAWSIMALFISYKNPTIGISDMFYFISRAETLSLTHLSPWVCGFNPLGYPFVLNSLFRFTGDYEFAGRVISLVSGLLSLVIMVRISNRFFGHNITLLATIFVCTNPHFMRFATISGTDMPTVALFMVAFDFLGSFIDTGKGRDLSLAGFMIGVAYLFRYNALTIVPAILFWLCIVRDSQSPKDKITSCFLFLLPFLLASSPQLVLSTIAKGNPFYNLQSCNVYFGMFGGNNWAQNWWVAREYESLGQILADHSIEFLRHWYYTIISVFTIELLQEPLPLIGWAGLFYSLKFPRTQHYTLLIWLILVSYIAAICMAFCNTRLLLLCIPLLSIFAAFGCIHFVPSRIRLAFKKALHLRTFCVVVLSLWLVVHYGRGMVLNPLPEFDRVRIIVSQTLASVDVKPRPREVLAFSFEYYDMSLPTKERYSISWFAKDFIPYDSVADIALRMRNNQERFLLFDENACFFIRDLQKIWPFNHDEVNTHFDKITTIADRVHIYRLKPNE